MTENEIKPNQDILNKEIEEFSNDLDDEYLGKTTDTEYEYVIHRYITENETETSWDTLNKAIEECPDDLYDEEG